MKSRGVYSYYHDGRRFYLGRDYDKALELHRAAILRINSNIANPAPIRKTDLLISEAVQFYLEGPVSKMGKSDAHRNFFAIKTLVLYCGAMPAESFRVQHVEHITNEFCKMRARTRTYKSNVCDGRPYSRQYVTKLLGCIRQCWRYLALHDYVSADCAAKVTLAVRAAKKNASPSLPPTRPVSAEAVRATVQFLPPAIADMVSVQIATGMRTGELVSMTWEAIDSSGSTWIYAPPKHKNSWRGHQRRIYLPDELQEILRKYPNAGAGQTLWGVPFDRYYRHLRTAQEKAGVEPWRPYQLRHAAATEILKRKGAEAAKFLLGHAGGGLLKLYTGSEPENMSRSGKLNAV